MLVEMGNRIFAHFIDPDGSMCFSCFSSSEREQLAVGLKAIKAESPESVREGRRLFDEAQAQAVKAIEAQCYSQVPRLEIEPA